MPLYSVQCPDCKTRGQIFRKVEERDANLPSCCGKTVERILDAAMLAPMFTSYVSPATGKVINNRQAQDYDLKATNSIMNEPGLRQDIARWGEEHKEKTFEPIAAAVDEKVRAMVNSGQLESV